MQCNRKTLRPADANIVSHLCNSFSFKQLYIYQRCTPTDLHVSCYLSLSTLTLFWSTFLRALIRNLSHCFSRLHFCLHRLPLLLCLNLCHPYKLINASSPRHTHTYSLLICLFWWSDSDWFTALKAGSVTEREGGEWEGAERERQWVGCEPL